MSKKQTTLKTETMKKVLIIMLALVSGFGFSQETDRKKEMKKEMMQERQNLTAEQKAELQTKKMTLHLDLTEAQQRQVYVVQLEMAKKRELIKEEKKAQKEEAGFYDKANKRLDHQIAYKEKMKAILTDQQYETWTEKMNNHKKRKALIKQKKKQ
tara:strand:+ start:49584 stop:50048 length:465 start_codon:yes stop_codon:yes gene_type:complete